MKRNNLQLKIGTYQIDWLHKSMFILLSLALVFSPITGLTEYAYADEEQKPENEQKETSGDEENLSKEDEKDQAKNANEQADSDQDKITGEDDEKKATDDEDGESKNDQQENESKKTSEQHADEADSDKDSLVESDSNEEYEGTISLASNSDYDVKDHPDGSVMITLYHGNETELIIPNEIDGKKVSEIRGGAFRGKGLTSVTIPTGVTRIGDMAFADNSLTTIDFPNQVNFLDAYSFANNNLTTIDLPDNVRHVQKGAFAGNNLHEVTIRYEPAILYGSEIFVGNQTNPKDLTIRGYKTADERGKDRWYEYAERAGHTIEIIGDSEPKEPSKPEDPKQTPTKKELDAFLSFLKVFGIDAVGSQDPLYLLEALDLNEKEERELLELLASIDPSVWDSQDPLAIFGLKGMDEDEQQRLFDKVIALKEDMDNEQERKESEEKSKQDEPKPEDKERSDEETDDAIVTVISSSDEGPKTSFGNRVLPSTATPYYTLMALGLLLLVIGGAMYLYKRRKSYIKE